MPNNNNHLSLAVAGSRKTQGIVDNCEAAPHGTKILVLTFTTANQAQLVSRLRSVTGENSEVEVLGWFTFLLRHWARPFIPYMFLGKHVEGFNYEGRPTQYASGYERYFDSSGAAYGCELARLATEIEDSSEGALMHRLECMYDRIYVDEVQDLSGHDWEIIDKLLDSKIEIHMVGDIRQAIISTNPRTPKNKQFRRANILPWFQEREIEGRLTITQKHETWRCHPDVAAFADKIFGPEWGFPPTISLNTTNGDHDGMFILAPEDVEAYVAKFQPLCLRISKASGKEYDLDFMNFGVSKGLTRERVLIVPTGPIKTFMKTGKILEDGQAAPFYVAVTRAQQSVAIVYSGKDSHLLPHWEPRNSSMPKVPATPPTMGHQETLPFEDFD